MQKIKKGLQEKLYLINKIKNNLKIKRYDLSSSPPTKTKVDFPLIENISQSPLNDMSIQFQPNTTRNPQNQIYTWINIKRLANSKIDFQDNYPSRQSKKSFDDKILMSTYTSRFAAKNSLMKIVQLKSLIKDKSNKNISSQYLRKTFLEKNSRTFSPDKLDKNKLKGYSPQKDTTFYGKINSTNHVSGIRFKTLDPRFGGLTREELKQKIKKRQFLQSDFTTTIQSPTLRLPQPRNLYELNISYNTPNRERNSSFSRYSNMSYNIDTNRQQRSKRRKQSRSKDRYSPWNQNSEEVLWDELPKIK